MVLRKVELSSGFLNYSGMLFMQKLHWFLPFNGGKARKNNARFYYIRFLHQKGSLSLLHDFFFFFAVLYDTWALCFFYIVHAISFCACGLKVNVSCFPLSLFKQEDFFVKTFHRHKNLLVAQTFPFFLKLRDCKCHQSRKNTSFKHKNNGSDEPVLAVKIFLQEIKINGWSKPYFLSINLI